MSERELRNAAQDREAPEQTGAVTPDISDAGEGSNTATPPALTAALVHERRHPPFDGDKLERVLYWVQVVTRPVADHGPANDEMCQVEARSLYNLTQALEAYDRGR